MSDIGAIVWTDLTVPDAEKVRDFYQEVVGWEHDPVSMGDYADYNMKRPDGKTVAGVCHARGVNATMPAQWMIYLQVADLDASMDACKKLGGEVIVGPREMGEKTSFCVIRDPAGAVVGLIATKP